MSSPHSLPRIETKLLWEEGPLPVLSVSLAESAESSPLLYPHSTPSSPQELLENNVVTLSNQVQGASLCGAYCGLTMKHSP